MKQSINEEFKRMQQLAGIQLNEIKVIPPSDLKIKWLKTDLDEYYEKGLADGFEMVDGKKVKEIIGYYEDEEGDEEVDIIGYIYSLSKDIESYSEDELDDIFTDNLNENDDDSSPESFDVNQDWNNLEILGTHTDHQGTWVDFADPEDPYLDEEGYSFAIKKRQINKQQMKQSLSEEFRRMQKLAGILTDMEDLINYLENISEEVLEAFMEDYGVNGYDLLTSGTKEEAEELLKQYM